MPMTTPLDLLYVTLFAVAFPVWDYLVSWPASRRRLQADPARARTRLWTSAIVYPWITVTAGAALWVFNGRPWTLLGFSMPDGWRLWVAVALVLLVVVYIVQSTAAVARDPAVRENVRQQAENVADLMPRTQADMYLFGGVSLTAGFCEEFLFRGYFIWALAPWLGWWGAAGLSVLIFAIAHAYQGWSGVLRTGIVGAFFTLIVAISGSLWPAMILHFLWDLGMGMIAWLALREGQV